MTNSGDLQQEAAKTAAQALPNDLSPRERELVMEVLRDHSLTAEKVLEMLSRGHVKADFEPAAESAKALNDRGIATPRGGQWQSTEVMRLLDRLGL